MADIIERSRFAFDMGTNSIGWAVYRLDERGRPCELVDCGVRLFSDGRNPKDGTSLAAMRRGPRAARRRRDRFLQRRDWLMQLLIRHGLMPGDEAGRKALEGLDPYALRARGLDERLEPFEVGRALFHLNQRRGYQSNRIADAKADDDKGKIASAAERLREKLRDGGFRTLGEFQAAQIARGEGTRARLNGEGAKAFYEVYPQRDMLKAEFDALWAAQAAHHPALMTERAREAIREAMFHQRPLKAPPVGRCTFFPEMEARLSEAHPTAQRFRIYQELANITVKEGLERPRKLTLEERDRLAEPLLAGEDLTWAKVRRALDLGGAAEINLEEGGKDRFKGDGSAYRLGGGKGALKRLWPNLDEARRVEVIERLLAEPDEAALRAWLVAEIGATEDEAEAAAGFRPPDGHIRLGLTAARGVVEALKAGDPATGETIVYSQAVQQAFPHLHHSDFRDGEVVDRLPDYRTVLSRHVVGTNDPRDPKDKRLGRLPNPTVHIGLNQLRRVTNALIETYGRPSEVVLELARELKQSLDDKKKAQANNRENERKNALRREALEAAGLPDNPQNMRLYRLWEDLGTLPRLCTYTGRAMSFDDVFSDRVEIEHILPFSRTLDDSMANKTRQGGTAVCSRELSKGNAGAQPQRPHEPADDPPELSKGNAGAQPQQPGRLIVGDGSLAKGTPGPNRNSTTNGSPSERSLAKGTPGPNRNDSKPKGTGGSSLAKGTPGPNRNWINYRNGGFSSLAKGTPGPNRNRIGRLCRGSRSLAKGTPGPNRNEPCVERVNGPSLAKGTPGPNRNRPIWSEPDAESLAKGTPGPNRNSGGAVPAVTVSLAKGTPGPNRNFLRRVAGVGSQLSKGNAGAQPQRSACRGSGRGQLSKGNAGAQPQQEPLTVRDDRQLSKGNAGAQPQQKRGVEADVNQLSKGNAGAQPQRRRGNRPVDRQLSKGNAGAQPQPGGRRRHAPPELSKGNAGAQPQPPMRGGKRAI